MRSEVIAGLARAAVMLVVAIELVIFALGTWPHPTKGDLPGYTPDTPEYVAGAEALLNGHYVLQRDGSTYIPRYTPGFAALLMPAVALGGPEVAVWVPFLAALVTGLLVAVVAWRASTPLAAAVALPGLMFTPAFVISARMIMSDIPVLALGLVSALLLPKAQRRWLVAAGAMAGLAGFTRPALFVLVLAGCIGIADRRRITYYLLGAMPALVLLGIYQWLAFGSPLASGYVANGATDAQGHLFRLEYVLGRPFNEPAPSNFVAYTQALFGTTGVMLWPGLGLMGVAGLCWLTRGSGAPGTVGRYGLAAVGVVLGVHLTYFFQAERFLFPAAAMLSVGGSAFLALTVRKILAPSTIVAMGLALATVRPTQLSLKRTRPDE